MLYQIIETGTIITYGGDETEFTDTAEYSIVPNPFTYGYHITTQSKSWWNMWVKEWKQSIELKSVYELRYRAIYEEEDKYYATFASIEE